MTVLLTGAAGFLGRELSLQLELSGREVHGVDLKLGEYVSSQLDVTSGDFLPLVQTLKPKIIVHMAGVQYLHPVIRYRRAKFFRSNVLMADNIARAIKEVPGIEQVIFVSTDMVYGKAGQSPVSIETQLDPIGHYGKSKMIAESVLEQAAKDSGVPLVVFRPRLIAGAGRLGTLESLHKLISRNLPVPIIGKGLNRYQFVAKEDVASAILRSIEKKSNGVYNLGSDNPPMVKDLLTDAIRIIGTKSKLVHLNERLALIALRVLDMIGISPLSPEQFEIATIDRILDTAATKAELGWRPTKTDLDMLVASFEYLNSRK